MKILVADDDPISALVLSNILVSSGHECQVAQDGNEAWELLQGEDPPSVAFIDWMMPGLDGLELTRRTRALGRSTYTYIVIVSALNRQEEVMLGYEAGADDFITKPYRPEEVVARQRVAERVVQTTLASSSLRGALEEARIGNTGDVVVRSGSTVGRIVFQAGKVAWASVSTHPSSLVNMLVSESTLDVEDIRAAVEESNIAGISLAQVVLNWELLPVDELRAMMRAWISQQVTRISLMEPSAVLFSPFSRCPTSPILFNDEDFVALRLANRTAPVLLADGVANSSTRQRPLPIDDAFQREASARLEETMAIEGVLAAAIFDAQTGRWPLMRGGEQDLDLDLAWRNIKLAMSAPSDDAIDDIIISTRERLYILRHYSQVPLRFIFLAADRAQTRLGMLRHGFAACTRETQALSSAPKAIAGARPPKNPAKGPRRNLKKSEDTEIDTLRLGGAKGAANAGSEPELSAKS